MVYFYHGHTYMETLLSPILFLAFFTQSTKSLSIQTSFPAPQTVTTASLLHTNNRSIIKSVVMDSSCVTMVNTSSYGWIASPHYPRGYPPGIRCEWIVDLGLLNQIVVRVQHVHLLQGDELRIFDGSTDNSPLLATYRERIGPTKVVSSTGHLLLRLYSTAMINPIALRWLQYEVYGFNLTYQIYGLCIPGMQRSCASNPVQCYDILTEACNGLWDCPEDGSDEWNCSNDCRGVGRYFCPPLTEEESLILIGKRRWGVAKCYGQHQRCDGDPTCPGMQDEKNCPSSQCGLHNGTWRCRTSGECIYAMYRCDGVTGDCSDESDERNCYYQTANYTNDEGDPFYYWRNAATMPVILAAVIGSLATCLVLITTVAYIVRLRTQRIVIRNRDIFCSFDSPLQRLVEAELRRRRPPPRYEEVMGINATNSLISPDSHSNRLNTSRTCPDSAPNARSSNSRSHSRRRRSMRHSASHRGHHSNESAEQRVTPTNRLRAARHYFAALMNQSIQSPLEISSTLSQTDNDSPVRDRNASGTPPDSDDSALIQINDAYQSEEDVPLLMDILPSHGVSQCEDVALQQ